MSNPKWAKFIGCSDDQATFAGAWDPRKALYHNKWYRVERLSVHSFHTRVYLKDIRGWFNSVCFEFEDKPFGWREIPEETNQLPISSIRTSDRLEVCKKKIALLLNRIEKKGYDEVSHSLAINGHNSLEYAITYLEWVSTQYLNRVREEGEVFSWEK